jgi:DNA-binding Lrp family transcriptional regulator
MTETMTVKEVAEILNVSEKHILVTTKKLLPDKLKNGIKTLYNEAEVTAIKLQIEKNPYLYQSVELKTELEKKLIIAQAIDILQNDIKELQQENLQLKSDVKLLVHDFQKTFTTSEIAKELQMKSAQELNKKLVEMKIQYKRNNTWVLYSPYSEKNYTSIKEQKLESGQIVYDRNWTGEGRMFILRLFNNDQIIN